MTNPKTCDTIYSQKGKENPKHQKGNESMLKVVMNGAIESLSTVPGLPEAMEILHPAIDNPKVSGRAEDMETGEVLIIVENGTVTYIAPETMTEMLDTIFEADPILAMGLAAALIDLS